MTPSQRRASETDSDHPSLATVAATDRRQRLYFWWIVGLIGLSLSLGVALVLRGGLCIWALLCVGYVWVSCLMMISSE